MRKKTARQLTQDEIREGVATLRRRMQNNRTRIAKIETQRRQEERRLAREFDSRVDPIAMKNQHLVNKIIALQSACRNIGHPGVGRRFGKCPDCGLNVVEARSEDPIARQGAQH